MQANVNGSLDVARHESDRQRFLTAIGPRQQLQIVYGHIEMFI